VQKTTHINP